MMPAYMTPDCAAGAAGYCTDADCAAAVKPAPDGHWFVTMGHAGFNSPANNRSGYATKTMAVTAHARYAKHAAKRGA